MVWYKKNLLMILLATMGFLLLVTGCIDNENTDDLGEPDTQNEEKKEVQKEDSFDDVDDASEAEIKEEDEEDLTQEAPLNMFAFIASRESQVGYLKATSDYNFVVLTVAVANLMDNTVHVNPYSMTLVDDLRSSYSIHPITFHPELSGHALDAVDVRPSYETRGMIIYEIPEEREPYKLIFDAGFWTGDIIVEVLDEDTFYYILDDPEKSFIEFMEY